jgi:hypothetical protein
VDVEVEVLAVGLEMVEQNAIVFIIAFSTTLLQANERKAVSIQADDPIAFMQLLATAENEILEVRARYYPNTSVNEEGLFLLVYL